MTGGQAAEIDHSAYRQERVLRMANLRVARRMTALVTAGVALYVLATLDEPGRELMAAILVAVGMTMLPLPLAPLRRLMLGRRWERYLYVWTAMFIAAVALLVGADGGIESPLLPVMILPLLFAALSYPLTLTTATGATTITAMACIAAYSGASIRMASIPIFVMVCVALLAASISKLQQRRQAELVEVVEALAESERRSAKHARQQNEIARFGREALAVTDLEELLKRATEAIPMVIEADIATVTCISECREQLRVVATHGIDLSLFTEQVPVAGSTTVEAAAIETGDPVMVSDWSTEKQVTRPGPVASRSDGASLTVPIRTHSGVYGALTVHRNRTGEVGESDVSFLDALANILGSAIERLEREQQTRHDALHDSLTGLANRTLFADRLRLALARCRRRGTSLAVLFLDLDDFKLVNDSLGHGAGDELIRSIAPRLTEAVRVTDTVARFGGDEFTVLVEDIEGEQHAQLVANRIIESFVAPFDLGDREHHARVSIGIAVGDGEDTPESLMRDADTALYSAKDGHRGSSALFDGDARAKVLERVQTEGDLRKAIKRGELELHYQPVVRIPDRTIVGFEALIRWRHGTRGLLGPDAFVDLAEDARLMGEIGQWVLEEACGEAAKWPGLRDGEKLSISVNLSASQLVHPSFPAVVESVVSEAGISPGRVRLEVNESALIEDPRHSTAALENLSRLGVDLVLDDFGTGYSALSYLKRLPLSAIKLDRSFLVPAGSRSPDGAIVAAMVDLARALELDVVAEGVETREQLQRVRDIGCEYAQGYLFSRPVPASEIVELLAATTA